MDSILIFGLIVGGLIGLFVGRMWAENSRARCDMKKVWRGRRDYRQG